VNDQYLGVAVKCACILTEFCEAVCYVHLCSKLSEFGVQRGSDGSVSVSDSVLVKVSGADEDSEKEVLVSWSLQVSDCSLIRYICTMVKALPMQWMGFKQC